MSHTPTPWEFVADDWNSGDDPPFESIGSIKTVPTSADDTAWYIATLENAPNQVGNAAFIVRACNSHDDLLKALKSTLSTLDFAIQKGVIECHGVREAALAAIRGAEGK